MPEYTWSPPTHPDPPEDQPLGIPSPDEHRAVDHAPAWAEVDFTRTGHQRIPGFVDAVGDGRVLVQFVHMGFAHKVWLPTSHTEPRELRRRAPRG